MNNQQLLRDIKRIAMTVPGTDGAEFFIFGSRARGDAREHSDVDLGVECAGGAPLPPGVLSDLQEAFDTSSLIPRVQVVDMARVSDQFRSTVLPEAVTL